MTHDDRRHPGSPAGAAGTPEAGAADDDRDGLELPPGIARRLATIDRLLPATPPWHAARADRDTPRDATATRPRLPADALATPLAAPRVIVRARQPIGSLAGTALLVAAVLVAVALVAPGRLGTGPQGPGAGGTPVTAPSAGVAGSASPSPAASASAGAPSSGASSPASSAPAASGPPDATPTASAGPGELVVVRGPGDGLTVLTDRLGWACASIVKGAASPNPSMVDKVAITGKVRTGWLKLPDGGRAWLGTSVVDAATAYGADVLAIGSAGDAWIVLREKPVALALRAEATPLGRTFWTIPATAQERPCPTRSSAP